MKLSRKAFLLIASQAIMLLALGFSPAPAAAGPMATLYVDDDGKDCKTTYNTIGSALVASITSEGRAMKRIYVCAGSYHEPIYLDHIANLKVIGLGNPVVYTPYKPYMQSLISVVDSTNITITGLTIDGERALPDDAVGAAIEYIDSSGAIDRNTVTGWRGPSLYSKTASRWVGSIRVDTTRKIFVVRNTVTDFQAVGIQVFAGKNSIVSANTVTGTAHNTTVPPHGMNISGTSLRVSDNIVTGDTFPAFDLAYGIVLYRAHQILVMSNVITHWETGIWVDGTCSSDSSSSSDRNTIKQNRIMETNRGILIEAFEWGGTCEVHNDRNQILYNRIVNTNLIPGTTGIQVRAFDHNPEPVPDVFAIKQRIVGNTITNFETGIKLDPLGGGKVSIISSGNHITP